MPDDRLFHLSKNHGQVCQAAWGMSSSGQSTGKHPEAAPVPGTLEPAYDSLNKLVPIRDTSEKLHREHKVW